MINAHRFQIGFPVEEKFPQISDLQNKEFFRKKRYLTIRMVAVFILWIPIGSVLLVITHYLDQRGVFITLSSMYLFFGGYCVVSRSLLKCIRCGNRFYIKGFFSNPYRNGCAHCGLKKLA